MFHGSSDHQTFNPHTRNPKLIHHHSFSRENFSPSNVNTMGILQAPPPYLSHSYHPYSLLQQQPPLLPLPMGPVRILASRGLSSPPVNKKFNNNNRTRDRDHSLTPKKSKNPKKEGKNSPKKFNVVSSTNPLGSDVKNVLPKAVDEDQIDMFSGSAVLTTISPPPSSLPLPSFSLRPKLSCKVEAVAVDTGATDNLRRLLRL